MAKSENQVVRLDKKSLDAINQLRKAIEEQNRIAKKNQKPCEVKPGVRLREDGSVEPPVIPGLARGGFVDKLGGDR